MQASFRALRSIADQVDFAVLAENPEPEALSYLNTIGARVFPIPEESVLLRSLRIAKAVFGGRNIPAARYLWPQRKNEILDYARQLAPDVVILADPYMAELIPDLRKLGLRVVLDTYNVESVLHARTAASMDWGARRLSFSILAWNTRRLERRYYPLADRLLAASSDDADWYHKNLNLRRVDVVPNVVALPQATATRGSSRTIVYSGFFAYAPNQDAAARLLALSQDLEGRGVEHRLRLVGRGITAELAQGAKACASVEAVGAVESMEPYLLEAALFVAPLAAGSGTKFKILQALAAGLPVVTTAVGAEGLDLKDGEQALVRPLGGIADAVEELLGDEAKRFRIGDAGRRHVAAHFSPESLEAAWRATLKDL